MTVTVAKTAGFCYGVKRAVELAQQAAQDGKPCVMLGPIIHNAHVVDALAEQGIGCVSSPEEVPGRQPGHHPFPRRESGGVQAAPRPRGGDFGRHLSQRGAHP